jgi:hypothetical protein
MIGELPQGVAGAEDVDDPVTAQVRRAREAYTE